jgi:CRP-like cAMP-binding protein
MPRTNIAGAAAPDTESCLETKLSHYAELDAADRALLRALEDRPEHRPRKSVVVQAGDRTDQLYVVRKGWLYSFQLVGDGRRQVFQIFYPGDIVGVREIGLANAISTTVCATDCILCPFEKTALCQLFNSSSRLSALLFAVGMVEEMVIIERMKAISRMQARERIAHVFLEMLTRLRITRGAESGAAFDFPLNQETLGDLVGLTQVHTNRTLRALERESLIRRQGARLEMDEARLRQISGFNDGYFRIDTSWIPR